MGTQYVDRHIGETVASDDPAVCPPQIGVTPADLEWVPAWRIGAGAETVVLEGNPETADPFTFRLKLPPHFQMGVHMHHGAERMTVIAGTLHLGIGETFDASSARAYPAGSFVVVAPETPMFSFTGPEGALVQVHGVGPWEVRWLR